jgi:hypothetical protein
VSRLTKRFLPFHWKDAPSVAFTQGQAKTFKATEIGLFDPERRVKTMVLASGGLPSGVRIVGTTVQYDGVGSAATSSFALTASDGIYTHTSSSGTATVETTQTNTPPQWTVPDGYSLGTFTTTAGGVFDLTSVATDAEGDPMAFTRTGGTAPGSVTVSESGVLTVPAGLTASTYTVRVGLDQAAGTAEADWFYRAALKRDTGGSIVVDTASPFYSPTGVVWACDFPTDASVEAFRTRETPFNYKPVPSWENNYRDTTDGVTGGACFVSEQKPMGPLIRLATGTIISANTVEFTTQAAHGLQVGDGVDFRAIEGTGWSGLNLRSYLGHLSKAVIAVSNATTFRIGPDPAAANEASINTAGWGTYTPNTGQVQKYRECVGGWWRPFFPVVASGNGLGYDDHACGGTLPRQSWVPQAQYNYLAGNYKTGLYGHNDYRDGTNGLPKLGNTADWHGDEFWLQFRTKIPKERVWTGSHTRGKLAMLEWSYTSGNRGQYLLYAPAKWVGLSDTPPYAPENSWYNTTPQSYATYLANPNAPSYVTVPYVAATGGTQSLLIDDGVQFQVNGDWAATCPVTGTVEKGVGACWFWPTDEWVTIMLHFKAGHANAWIGRTIRTISSVTQLLAGVVQVTFSSSHQIDLGTNQQLPLKFYHASGDAGWRAFWNNQIKTITQTTSGTQITIAGDISGLSAYAGGATAGPAYNDTTYEVFATSESLQAAQRAQGQPCTFQRIMRITDWPTCWFQFLSNNALPAWNSINLTAYLNEVPQELGAVHKFDQVILSKSEIPCPQV